MAVSIEWRTAGVVRQGPCSPDRIGQPGWTRPRSCDVSRDGEGFLMAKRPASQPRPRIAVVLNWFDELRAKVPR